MVLTCFQISQLFALRLYPSSSTVFKDACWNFFKIFLYSLSILWSVGPCRSFFRCLRLSGPAFLEHSFFFPQISFFLFLFCLISISKTFLHHNYFFFPFPLCIFIWYFLLHYNNPYILYQVIVIDFNCFAKIWRFSVSTRLFQIYSIYI